MAQVEKIVEQMRSNPRGIRFTDLAKVCDHYFGSPRHNDGSHRVYRMPWRGDPRINIQPGSGGKAKEYQVRDVLKAIDGLSQDFR